MALTAGQASDHIGARIVYPGLPNAGTPIGDKGYDSDELRATLKTKGIASCIPPTDLREVLSALRYPARSGGGCCRRTFRPGTLRGGSGVLFAGCCCALSLDREREGCEQGLTAAIVDRRSIKAPAARKRGGDAAGKVVGRKRHIAVDTDGRLLMVNRTGADISDSAEVREIVAAIGKRWPWLKHLCADGAYDRTRLMDAAACRDFVLEIIGRTEKQAGFKVLPRRRSSNEPLDG